MESPKIPKDRGAKGGYKQSKLEGQKAINITQLLFLL